MAEGASGGGPGARDRDPKASRSAPRMGRRLATLVFWIAALYVGTVGFYSITRQVFWPEKSSDWEAGCAEGIRTLESELLSRASQVVAGGGAADSQAARRRWLEDWDARHQALDDRCEGAGAEAHADLARLRYRVATLIERFERDEAPLVREIDRNLSRATTH